MTFINPLNNPQVAIMGLALFTNLLTIGVKTMNAITQQIISDFKNFSTIGLNDLFQQAQSLPFVNYPPSNLIEIHDDEKKKFLIEIAVAGFKKKELSVTKSGDYIHIKSTKEDEAINGTFVHRGFARRNFHLRFLVAKFVEIIDVKLVDGVLQVSLERIIPESEKDRIFEIL
jgi:molecular chaperone IbpA